MGLIQKTNDFDLIRDIRIKIFNKELGLSNDNIFDEDDNKLEQFLIVHNDNAVGTFRLRDVDDFHKIEKMGILSEYRSKGFGKLALDEIKVYSKNASKSKIILDSIYDVRDFYTKSGFVQSGEIYFKVEIPHVNMFLKI